MNLEAWGLGRARALVVVVSAAACVLASGCGQKRSDTTTTTQANPSDSLRRWPADSTGAPLAEGQAFALPAPAIRDTISLYVSKLHDRTFWMPYGEEDEPSKWWLAAERLGEIGAPAIPSLVNTLGERDSFTVMLALYGLLLASQDPEVMRHTGGEYINYHGVVLDSTSNAVHKAFALDWWVRHRGLWEGTSHALP